MSTVRHVRLAVKRASSALRRTFATDSAPGNTICGGFTLGALEVDRRFDAPAISVSSIQTVQHSGPLENWSVRRACRLQGRGKLPTSTQQTTAGTFVVRPPDRHLRFHRQVEEGSPGVVQHLLGLSATPWLLITRKPISRQMSSSSRAARATTVGSALSKRRKSRTGMLFIVMVPRSRTVRKRAVPPCCHVE